MTTGPGERRWRARLAAILSAGLIIAPALPLAADQGADGTGTEAGMEASLSLAFADKDTSGSTFDWGASSGGPQLDLGLWSTTRFGVAGLPWFRMGPSFEAEVSVDTATVTPSSGDPYLVADSAFLRGLAGWGAEGSFPAGPGKLKAGLTALAGLGVLDLSDADSDYLEAGATAEYFWFRVEPCLGLDAALGYKTGAFDAKLHERIIFTWDSGNAYDRDWTPGFEEDLEAKAGYRVFDARGFDLDLRALADFSYASRIVVPVLKYSAALRADLDWKDVGTLRLTPLAWAFRAEVPEYDLSQASDLERQLSARVEWEGKLGDGTWSAWLALPWWASLDGTESAGEWKIGLSWKGGD